MKAIVEGFQWLIDTITTVYDFFVDFVTNMILFFQYLGNAAASAYTLVAYLPGWLQAFGTICIFTSVLYLILGRSTGGKKGGSSNSKS